MAVIALAGRRIDAAEAKPARFPSTNVALVRDRIRRELAKARARGLVCSAACGADLVALDVAGELGMRRRIILPFDEARFRKTSVVDRGGDWGGLFDTVVADRRRENDVVTLAAGRDEAAAFAAANTKILDEAQSLGAATRTDVLALLVWDGKSRGPDDVTAAFGADARRRRLRVVEVPTL